MNDMATSGPLSTLSPSSQNSKAASPSSTTSSFVQIEKTPSLDDGSAETYMSAVSGTRSPASDVELGKSREDTLTIDFGDGQQIIREGSEGVVQDKVSSQPPSSPFVPMVTLDLNSRTEGRSVSETSTMSSAPSISTSSISSTSGRRVSMSPGKRFPVKVSVSGGFEENNVSAAGKNMNPTVNLDGARSPRKSFSPTKQPMTLERPQLSPTKTTRSLVDVERTLRFNEGLTRAVESMDIYEEEESVIHYRAQSAGSETDDELVVESHAGDDEGMSTIYDGAGMNTNAYSSEIHDETANIEGDTCLSTFSAVPNTDMTTFARLGEWTSPIKTEGWTPGQQLRSQAYTITPRSHRRGGGDSLNDDGLGSASPTPRRGGTLRKADSRDEETTRMSMNLLEFTDQFNVFTSGSRYSPHGKRASPAKSSGLSGYLASRRAPSPGKGVPSTPHESRTLANLLDFDIPPAPTPRSVPSITARELESLKSGFLSQISSLRASLNGKKAEVNSLKEAVGDAERRVGEATENVRDEVARREGLETEWERRGRDMEEVLRGVKEEIIIRDRENQELRERADASEKKREEMEGKLDFVSSQLVAAREGKPEGSETSTTTAVSDGTTSNKDIQEAVERVARELHALYKGKHETKVSALKKSYEARWEKRVKEIETKLATSEKENERLRTERDATMSGVVPPSLMDLEAENKAHAVREEGDRTMAREMKAKIAGLESEIVSVKRDQEELLFELERERVEKGELVAAVDELLDIQSGEGASILVGGGSGASAAVEDLKKSVRGLKAPGFGLASAGGATESRIGRVPAKGDAGPRRNRSGSSEKNMKGVYGVGAVGARGIMGSIERMGRGGAARD